jgi:hypothetical protein
VTLDNARYRVSRIGHLMQRIWCTANGRRQQKLLLLRAKRGVMSVYTVGHEEPLQTWSWGVSLIVSNFRSPFAVPYAVSLCCCWQTDWVKSPHTFTLPLFSLKTEASWYPLESLLPQHILPNISQQNCLVSFFCLKDERIFFPPDVRKKINWLAG